ncbi:hypothetical protein PR202_ga15124 [Eleusine coracana subsp. coracana]|uniref:CCHC-type domain-containing protein n=1 Tax=Eleusine coracana subsp. coracana TaxID=191504 RepID=A0AAV5CJB8_ELECO|nr:hypothetical protein PR202_ga15124 [Eleusine coracana subsp. coracana]
MDGGETKEMVAEACFALFVDAFKAHPPAALRRLHRPQNHHPTFDYKRWLVGRCYRCLAKNHQVSQCRDPVRCWDCRRNGHTARHCPTPLLLHHNAETTTANPPSIHDRLTFPPLAHPQRQAVHSRLAWPSTPGAETGARQPEQRLDAQSVDPMAYVPGFPEQRSVLVKHAMAQQLRVPSHTISVTRHQPEDFLVKFDLAPHRDRAVLVRYFNIAGTAFELRPWQLDNHTAPHTYWYHTKISIEGLPMHAWTGSALRQLFINFAVYDRMSSSSYLCDNSRICSCWVWMFNPDIVPLSVLCTILPETAGQTLEVCDLPTPHRRQPPPPEGQQMELILHIDEHHDYAPREDGVVPRIQPFTWTPGAFDNRPTTREVVQIPAAAANPRRRGGQSCRDPSDARERRDRDPDHDGSRRPRGDWRDRFTCHGRPHIRRSHGSTTDHGRRRGPYSHRRAAGEALDYDAADSGSESRGRTGTRSPGQRRGHQERRRHDDDWGPCLSRSPQPRPSQTGTDSDDQARDGKRQQLLQLKPKTKIYKTRQC